MPDLDKNYNAAVVEEKWYRRWLETKAFHAESDKGGAPYSIVIPPPNVTGILHMGHALNVTIQDILIRWRRMQGRNTLWIPGTDHAGIATQNVVERALRKEGKTRDDLGRDAFVERVWAWREQYGSTIVRQLKKLGAACDWDRERFTMDEGLSDAVAEVFIRLYEKKLIYRGNYIINWCPRCRTALSDEESVHVDTNGSLYYIRYPLKNGAEKDAVIVATTRPETLLGDVAVAVNPRDPRYASLAGKEFLLPVLNRALVVIRDDFVDPEFGTGVVKVTPAHDPHDFEMGRRHGLEPINVMNDDGTMNDAAGPYKGMDRFECRKRILAELARLGLVEKIEPHVNAVGHCYRCDTVVEPRLSLQWFVKMKLLAQPAIAAVGDGRIQFVPERWTKVYLEWMENIRDWCISRQIWWGHRIPVFYCDDCRHEWAAKGRSAECPACHSGKIRQDEDVLDTWFSSWLWPFSALGWPVQNKDLKFYYPTECLVTASEIIFFWVARMIVSGLEFMGEIPFRKVIVHGTVRDTDGRKMSKSLGNSIDPLAVIDSFSADALRFSLMMVTATGQDVFLSNDKFEIGRNFLTKIWNAARFMQMHSAPVATAAMLSPTWDTSRLRPDDQYIIAGLHKAIAACTENLERFRFNDAAKDLYEFVWRQFCDWHIESAKIVFNGSDPDATGQALRVMHYVFASILRLLHPLAPFITEELWHGMGYGAESETILFADWPKALADLSGLGVSAGMVAYVEQKHDLIRVGRILRADYGIAPSLKIKYIAKPENDRDAALLISDRDSIAVMLRAESLEINAAFVPPRLMPNGLSQLGALYMPIEGVIDVAAESRRLADQLEKATGDLAGVNKKLNNSAFVQKAPPDVIALQQTRRQEMTEKCEKLRRLLTILRGKSV
jgi:valyl-tRNA synthetase